MVKGSKLIVRRQPGGGAGDRLEAEGIKVARGTRTLAEERKVKDLIIVTDPAGHRVEFCVGPETASDPFKPGRNISGFRTGPLGLGHDPHVGLAERRPAR